MEKNTIGYEGNQTHPAFQGNSCLDGINNETSIITYAHKLQQRAASVGFDWADAYDVLAKVDEELAEVKEAMALGDTVAITEEMGDLLFVLINLARKLGFITEDALQVACTKFERRFRLMERAAAAEGTSLAQESLEKMEARWKVAKTL